MNRSDILFLLQMHVPVGGDEVQHVADTVAFIRNVPRAFDRVHEFGGHVGPSAVVVNPEGTHIFMAGHTVLKDWSFFGNHCEGNLNLPEVARERIAKDASEEIAAMARTKGELIDVDVHVVPPHERRGEPVPEHLHYDMAFLFELEVPFETVNNAAWFTLEEAVGHNEAHMQDPQIRRILKKLHIRREAKGLSA